MRSAAAAHGFQAMAATSEATAEAAESFVSTSCTQARAQHPSVLWIGPLYSSRPALPSQIATLTHSRSRLRSPRSCVRVLAALCRQQTSRSTSGRCSHASLPSCSPWLQLLPANVAQRIPRVIYRGPIRAGARAIRQSTSGVLQLVCTRCGGSSGASCTSSYPSSSPPPPSPPPSPPPPVPVPPPPSPPPPSPPPGCTCGADYPTCIPLSAPIKPGWCKGDPGNDPFKLSGNQCGQAFGPRPCRASAPPPAPCPDTIILRGNDNVKAALGAILGKYEKMSGANTNGRDVYYKTTESTSYSVTFISTTALRRMC